MKILSMTGAVSLNGQPVEAPDTGFDEGNLAIEDAQGSAVISYLDGDTVTLGPGEANFSFADAESTPFPTATSEHTDKNFNLRQIELRRGEAVFALKPRPQISKVTYSLRLGQLVVEFKDADLDARLDDTGKIHVSRGEAMIYLDGATPAVALVLTAGNALQIR